jgi:hypothetical protein
MDSKQAAEKCVVHHIPNDFRVADSARVAIVLSQCQLSFDVVLRSTGPTVDYRLDAADNRILSDWFQATSTSLRSFIPSLELCDLDTATSFAALYASMDARTRRLSHTTGAVAAAHDRLIIMLRVEAPMVFGRFDYRAPNHASIVLRDSVH